MRRAKRHSQQVVSPSKASVAATSARAPASSRSTLSTSSDHNQRSETWASDYASFAVLRAESARIPLESDDGNAAAAGSEREPDPDEQADAVARARVAQLVLAARARMSAALAVPTALAAFSPVDMDSTAFENGAVTGSSLPSTEPSVRPASAAMARVASARSAAARPQTSSIVSARLAPTSGGLFDELPSGVRELPFEEQ